jgi:hypothetical protein
MLSFGMVFSQKKPKVIYAPPVVVPEKEESEGGSMKLSPPPSGNEMFQKGTSTTPNTKQSNMAVGYSPPPEEIIRELNQPFRRDTFPKKIRVFLENGEKEIISEIGKEHFQQYVRINRGYIVELNKTYWKYHNLKRYDNFIGVRTVYTLVYQGFIIGNIYIDADTTGKISAKNKQKLHNELSAYKELFDGKLKVTPAEVVKSVFLSEKPNAIYHLSLRNIKAHSYTFGESNTFKPEIWWHIWENGCQKCWEAEIDANNLEKKIEKEVSRFLDEY